MRKQITNQIGVEMSGMAAHFFFEWFKSGVVLSDSCFHSWGKTHQSQSKLCGIKIGDAIHLTYLAGYLSMSYQCKN